VILLLILHFIVVISNVCILVYCSLLTMLYLMFAAKFYSATDENTDIWNSTELKQSFFFGMQVTQHLRDPRFQPVRCRCRRTLLFLVSCSVFNLRMSRSYLI
jgi:hypothetical protein